MKAIFFQYIHNPLLYKVRKVCKDSHACPFTPSLCNINITGLPRRGLTGGAEIEYMLYDCLRQLRGD